MRWIGSLVSRRRMDRDLADEIQAHLDERMRWITLSANLIHPTSCHRNSNACRLSLLETILAMPF